MVSFYRPIAKILENIQTPQYLITGVKNLYLLVRCAERIALTYIRKNKNPVVCKFKANFVLNYKNLKMFHVNSKLPDIYDCLFVPIVQSKFVGQWEPIVANSTSDCFDDVIVNCKIKKSKIPVIPS